MESTLSNSELDSIANRVSEIIYAKEVAKGSTKALREAAEKYTNGLIDFYMKDYELEIEAIKVLEPIVNKQLNESNIINKLLSEYMITNKFKQIELKHLKLRVSELERELFDEEN